MAVYGLELSNELNAALYVHNAAFEFFFQSPPYDSHPRHNNIPLTAFVLIAFCEINNIHGDLRARVASSKARAMAYLEQKLSSITDPYEMAIVAYALTLCGSVDSEMAFLELDKMKKELGMLFCPVSHLIN